MTKRIKGVWTWQLWIHRHTGRAFLFWSVVAVTYGVARDLT
jgi:hypothetical protein